MPTCPPALGSVTSASAGPWPEVAPRGGHAGSLALWRGPWHIPAVTLPVGAAARPRSHFMAARQQREEQEDISFFARSARHVLVDEGTRFYHSLLNFDSLQQHFLDDPHNFTTFICIRPRFATTCSTFSKR